ncbi:alpha-1B-glycoprotein-like isoform 2-T2 [Porphyrio hochstetteri]
MMLLTSPSSSRQHSSVTAFLLQLLPLAVSSVDPLPAPTLSTDPTHEFYYEGERFALICLAATKKKIGGFRFFNQSREQIHQQAPYSLQSAWLQVTATKASAGDYTCMYFVEESGQETDSNRSLPLSIKVQAAPVAPTLSLDPQQQVYSPGSSVKLLCSIPSAAAFVKEIQYYGDIGVAVSIPVADIRNYSYDLSITGQEVSGSYSCAYFVIQSARPVRSERSPWINVSVKNSSALEAQD